MNLFLEVFDNRSLYFDTFDRMVDAVYVIDAERRTVYINKAAEALDGYFLKDIKGKTVQDLYGLEGINSPALRALAMECPVMNEEFSYYVNGKEVIQLCNAGPIYEDGRLVGAYSIQRDMTRFKNMVEKNIALQRVINKQKNFDRSLKQDPFSRIIGSSDVFSRTVSQAQQAAKTDSSVMLIGSTGSGKEIFARAIHNGSNRVKKPFLALNCAAIPETLIESILFGTVKGVYTGAVEKDGILAQADGGTVFLDEINSMPLASQAKLLRVLEERRIMKLGSNKEVPIDIRVISSTNEDPVDAVRNQHMREDLLYRLSVVPIVIPPLRERKEDLPELIDYFIKKYNDRFDKHILGVDDAVMTCFYEFSWPGNVRQLKTCIESAMNFAEDGNYICLKDLPVYVFEDNDTPENRYRRYLTQSESNHEKSSEFSQKENTSAYLSGNNRIAFDDENDGLLRSIERAKRSEIIEAIRNAEGNLAKAARSLGISRQLMYYRVKKYNIKL